MATTAIANPILAVPDVSDQQRGRMDRSGEFQKLAATHKASIQLSGVESEAATAGKKRRSLMFWKKRTSQITLQPNGKDASKQPIVDVTEESEQAEQMMEMEQLYTQVPKVRIQLDNLEKQRKEVSRANRQCLMARDDDEAVKCNEFVEAAVRHVHSLVSNLKATLDSLDQETTEKLNSGKVDHPEDANLKLCLEGYANIRILTIKHYRQRLFQFMDGFQGDQREADAQKKEQLERQVRIIQPDLSKSEVDRIVADPELSASQIFGNSVLVEDARQALHGLEQRRVSMFALERSVGKLAMLFRDMQNLLSEQGELLVDTAKYLQGANEFLVQAKDTLAEGKTYAKNVRKLKCSIF